MHFGVNYSTSWRSCFLAFYSN